MFIDSEVQILLDWIERREELRKTRASGKPKPWTDDLVLRNYRWCNVRRLDDAVSCSLFAYWYDTKSTDPQEQITAAVIARLINWPPSLLVISAGAPFRMSMLKTMRKKLHARATLPVKIFTGAYVVPGVEGKTKIDSVCDTVDAVRVNAHFAARKGSMFELWDYLQTFDTLGSFLAGQVVADLAHVPIVGGTWYDRDTWAPLGPGSRRGMNRLLGRTKEKAMTQGDFEMYLRNLMTEIGPAICDIWADRKLQAFDIQNCLCEYDKYRRLQLGEGTVRATYPGEPSQGLFA